MGTILLPELKQYIYRKLGHPVINVEVDESQLEDCIDEAYKTFVETHYDACEIGYIPLEVTAGTGTYTLPETVQDVMECLNIEGQSGPGFGNIDPSETEGTAWPWRIGGAAGGYGGGGLCDWDLVDVEVWRQWYALWEDSFKTHIYYEFNQVNKKITFIPAPKNTGIRYLKVAKTATDIVEDNAVVDALWLKKYAVALARIQWGVNVGKYDGAQMPGGVSINYADIRQKGEDDKANLLVELEEKYSLPPDPVFA